MANTSLIEDVDNLAYVAVVAPVFCKKLTVRQVQSDITQLDYDVAAPSSANAAYRKNQGEQTEFAGGHQEQNCIQAGTTVGYIKTATGTADFSVITEP